MNFHIMTLFPEMVLQGLHTSIIGRAEEKGLITISAWNIRDYTLDKHKKVDDYPYGGGAGMLMQAQPVYDTWRVVSTHIAQQNASHIAAQNALHIAAQMQGQTEAAGGAQATVPARTRVVFLTPQGKTFCQEMAREYAQEQDLIFLCGHYEGIDERVLEEIVTDEVSIGDYVLTGGELPAMVMIDAIARMVPGVLSNEESGVKESFYENLLEYPQYSRPEVWHEKKVPDILLSGDHAKVDAWRLEQAKARTKERRPDLYEIYDREHPAPPPKKKRRRKKKEENACTSEPSVVEF